MISNSTSNLNRRSIFNTYFNQVSKELGGAPTKTLAIRLSGQPLDQFNGPNVIERLSAALSFDGWNKPVGKNWNWDSTWHHTADSDEVKLERAIVRAGDDLWARQMSTSSGIQGPHLNKRRAIDLVRKHDNDHYSFIELKINSDNPLYAIFELLGYGLAYRHAKANGWPGSGSHNVMSARSIDLVVLAPSNWFRIKGRRLTHDKSPPYNLDWLVAELNKGLAHPSAGMPVMQFSLEKFDFSERSIAKATSEIISGSANWTRHESFIQEREDVE